jgi:hypothetical protein
MKTSYEPTKYVTKLEGQINEVAELTAGLSESALNWQPNSQSWSIGQCLDHLVRTNEAVLAAVKQTVEQNRDELRPRKGEMQAAGWFSRWFIRTIGPESSSKLRAPKKIVPPSNISADVVTRFTETQKQIGQFVNEFREADLGALRYPNPLLPFPRWTVDTGLLILVRHNARHLQQAERVKKSAGFPG